MANFTIRNLDEPLKARLRVQAATHGRSMEDEARLRDRRYRSVGSIGHSGKSGWGGRIRTSGCRYQKPVPYRLATPQYAEFGEPDTKPYGLSETSSRAVF
jgi:hypothetical protein